MTTTPVTTIPTTYDEVYADFLRAGKAKGGTDLVSMKRHRDGDVDCEITGCWSTAGYRYMFVTATPTSFTEAHVFICTDHQAMFV